MICTAASRRIILPTQAQAFARRRMSEPEQNLAPKPLQAAAPKGKVVTADRRLATATSYFPSLHNMWQITWGSLRYKWLNVLLHREAKVRAHILDLSLQRARAAGATQAQIDQGDVFEIDVTQRFGASAEHFRLVVLGDAGERGDPSQMLLVPEMERVLAEGGVLFHGGDIYPVLNPHNLRIGFTEPYAGIAHKMLGFGNHDYWGRLTRCMRCDKTWNEMGKPPHLFYALVHPKLRFIWLDSGANGDAIDAFQLAWFENQLKKAQAQGQKVIVGFHHPFYVNGEALDSQFRYYVEPRLIRYKVPLVLTHHEHCFQRYHIDYASGHRIVYFMQGNGGGFITPTHGLKQKPKPEIVYPAAEKSRRNFTWNIFGYRMPIPHWARWVHALRSLFGRYKGFTMIDVHADGRVEVKHRVRDRYKAADGESDQPYDLFPPITI